MENKIQEEKRRIMIVNEKQRAIQIRGIQADRPRKEMMVKDARRRAVDRAHVSESHAEFHRPGGDGGLPVKHAFRYG
jgi:hypothetical protein